MTRKYFGRLIVSCILVKYAHNNKVFTFLASIFSTNKVETYRLWGKSTFHAIIFQK